MTPISQYDIYLSRMEKSMYDKMFFIDKIFNDKITTFFDFGCANGTLINYIHMFMPHLKYVGYDIDPAMCIAAEQNAPYAEFYSDWDKAFAQIDPTTTILNLSSVIHEIYSYEDFEGVKRFWDRVTNSGWAYIVIRDMVRFDSSNIYSFCDEQLLLDISWCLDKHPLYKEKWNKFQTIWDRSPEQIMHFLLKYRYDENWDREVQENYIPFTESEFSDAMWRMLGNRYTQTYKHIYTLPYIQNQIQSDLGYDIREIPTHMQYIYQKKD